MATDKSQYSIGNTSLKHPFQQVLFSFAGVFKDPRDMAKNNGPESQRCSLPSTTAAPFPHTVLLQPRGMSPICVQGQYLIEYK